MKTKVEYIKIKGGKYALWFNGDTSIMDMYVVDNAADLAEMLDAQCTPNATEISSEISQVA